MELKIKEDWKKNKVAIPLWVVLLLCGGGLTLAFYLELSSEQNPLLDK